MLKKLFYLSALLAVSTTACAQRFTDNLGRGLVAVPTGSTSGSTTNVVTWRRLADEYYDVTYNLYKDGTKVASGLTVTCYSDLSKALPTTTYQVEAVVRGVAQPKSDAVTPWAQEVYKLGDTRTPAGYLDIALATVYDRDGQDVTANYSPNDAEMADLDGDGELEIIIKRLNTVDASSSLTGYIYPESSREFVVIDAYDVNWQTGAASLMWRIDCGPNMVSLNSTEIDVIAYDWDEDGRAEVVLRGADNMIVYGSDGITQLYTVGDMSANTRNTFSTTDSQYAWTHSGAEYLLYINGQTGALYQQTEYPLKRLESGETSLKTAWGDDYGHRSSKYFFGAPFLDGRKASLFLGRGIYTRHKFMAMDLDRGSHQWTKRWEWSCNDKNSPWYGNGYHNFIIADVDEDGRDEIVYGSMVIDDNGHGLSTTGFQHGDAQHVGDFNPYRKGLEYFGCLEDNPYWGNNYRDATTGEVFYKHSNPDADGKTGDDGRCLMDNFTDAYPGCLGRSIENLIISSVTAEKIMDAPESSNDALFWSHLNFRIYWDGDLCSEILDSPGTASEAAIWDVDKGRLFTSSGCKMNNDSKNNPCFQGDIIGDWREEIVVRHGTDIRVYTSGLATSYSQPCLWFDHQYRQAMVWQMMAYNQPPHTSYFLGELEGITVAPPSYTNRGRTEIDNGGNITTTDRHLLLAETNDMTVSVSDGATPYMLTVNTPSWVQGTDVNGTSATKVKADGLTGVTGLPEINTTTYTHTLTGGAFTGSMRLVKQGDGTLVLPTVTETYTGNTDVWAGTLSFDGTMQNSPLWLNRFASLVSNGGTFSGGITADYGSCIVPGGKDHCGNITTSSLTLNYGARVLIDLYAGSQNADQINIGRLVIGCKSGDVWENAGPRYLTPVIEFVQHDGSVVDGSYDLGAVETVEGNLSDIQIEGLDGIETYGLQIKDGHLMLVIGTGVSYVCPEPVITENGIQRGTGGLLPAVDISVQSFLYQGSTVKPQLEAVFTDAAGNSSVVDIRKTLFSENFEGSDDPSAYWKYNNSGCIFSPGYSGSEGQCIAIMSSSDRGDYTPITADYSSVTSYVIEFDAYFNNASTSTNFVVMSKSHWASWTHNYGYRWKDNSTEEHNPYLLYLMRNAGSTTFAINETDNTMTLDNSKWYHFVLNVDVTGGTVGYTISQKGTTNSVASGTYTLPEGESALCDGIYIRNGRYQYEPGGAGIDNIHVYDADAFSYKFQKPGVLTVTSSNDGCIDSATEYEAVLTLDENDTEEPVATDGVVGIRMLRTIKANEWSTLCLPFDMTASQWQEAFGSDAEIRNINKCTVDGNTLQVVFSTAMTGTLQKNTPYIIRTNRNITEFSLRADVQPEVPETVITDGNDNQKGTFVGTYKANTVIPDGNMFLYADHFYFSKGLTKSKAYRAYFCFDDIMTSEAGVMMLFDNMETGINGIIGKYGDNKPVYDLQGRRLPETLIKYKGRKGIYVSNGSKTVNK